MDDDRRGETREHELTMHVFSVSAAMVGICLTAVGILRLVVQQSQAQTLGDDLLAIDSVLFVACCALAFWSFKTADPVRRRRLRLACDALFLAALAAMSCICAIIAYALI